MANVVKVPVILQMEALECGAASLAMVLSYYKRYIPLEQLRMDCGISRDGSKAGNIVRAAVFHGMKAKGYRYSVEKLKNLQTLPAIIHWNFNHFVVFCGFRGKRAVINDPASGMVTVPIAEFENSFTGIVLVMEPGEDFKPSGKRRSAFTFLKKYVGEYSEAALAAVICGFFIALAGMTVPVFSRIFMDHVLLGSAEEWMGYVTKAILVVIAFLFCAEACFAAVLFRARRMMGLNMNIQFLWHTLQLPAAFFSQRSSGDIAGRQMGSDDVAQTVFEHLIPICIEGLMVAVYFCFLFYLRPSMAFVAFMAMTVQFLALWISSVQLADDSRAISRDEGKYAGCAAGMVSMIETVKASGAEAGSFGKVTGYYAKYSNSIVRMKHKLLWSGFVPDILNHLCDAFVLVMGVLLIMDGNLTIGILLAFQGFLQKFLTPAQAFFAAGEKVQHVCARLERIEDVLAYPVDEEISFTQRNTVCKKLKGRLELKEISFAYGRLAPLFLQDVYFIVEPGQMVAFVGGSGSGKSTLASLIMGLYVPRSGQILFDGKERTEIERHIFTQSVSVVSQDIHLFRDTVRNNLTLWDDTIDDSRIIEACRMAGMYDDIMMRKDGLDFMISEEGRNLSGGQRQRLEIARALIKEPTLLILDEATSALDPPTEKRIMDAIRGQGITCIVIAHRLSTIRHADQILVFEHGSIVERGSHDKLLALDGVYAALIRSDKQ